MNLSPAFGLIRCFRRLKKEDPEGAEHPALWLASFEQAQPGGFVDTFHRVDQFGLSRDGFNPSLLIKALLHPDGHPHV